MPAVGSGRTGRVGKCVFWISRAKHFPTNQKQTLNEIDGGFDEYREEILSSLGEEINALGATGDNRDLSSEEDSD